MAKPGELVMGYPVRPGCEAYLLEDLPMSAFRRFSRIAACSFGPLCLVTGKSGGKHLRAHAHRQGINCHFIYRKPTDAVRGNQLKPTFLHEAAHTYASNGHSAAWRKVYAEYLAEFGWPVPDRITPHIGDDEIYALEQGGDIAWASGLNVCPLCGKSFRSMGPVGAHLTRAHDIPRRQQGLILAAIKAGRQTIAEVELFAERYPYMTDGYDGRRF